VNHNKIPTITFDSEVNSGLVMSQPYCRVVRNGVPGKVRLELPSYRKVCYFSQGHEPWPSSGIHIFPWVAQNDVREILRPDFNVNPVTDKPHPNGMFAVFELTDGSYLTLLPMSDLLTMSWLHLDGERGLEIQYGPLGSAEVTEDQSILSWARATDLYSSVRQTWALAIEQSTSRRGMTWRHERRFPEPFQYLGWCSWEQYRTDISSPLLEKVADDIHESNLPIRWLLVDDGHQDADKRKIKSFDPHEKKFPAGWEPLLNKRKKEGIRWMGLWHCFFAHWNGLHDEHQLPFESDELVQHQQVIPAGDDETSQKFQDMMIGSIKNFGFDFTKIDVQSWYIEKIEGEPNRVSSSISMSLALEEACERELGGLLNCMSLNTPCVFNTRYSAITRCSLDYQVNKEAEAKNHLMQSYSNTLWLGQTIWPDHDMFHSADKFCGEMMAVSKGLSGGPVCLSDAPEDFNEAATWPLVEQDGKIIRPLAPAVPLPESLFIDPLHEAKIYRTITPLAHKCAAIVLYNLIHPRNEEKVISSVSPEDYPSASAMIQPYPGPWKAPQEGLIVFNWHKKCGEKLDTAYEVELQGFSDCLLFLCPIQKGWAIVGGINKYLSPSVISVAHFEDDFCRIEIAEFGPVVIWRKDNMIPISKELGEAEDLKNGFWLFNVPKGIKEVTMT
jgi:hypothetical protein